MEMIDEPLRWIDIQCTLGEEEEAKERRKKCIELYGHLANTRNMTPDRWVGDLGEMVMHWWLDQNEIHHTWYSLEEQRSMPDFQVYDISLELKTAGRNRGVLRGKYNAGVNLKQFTDNDHTDEYFFASYNKDKGIMSLAGSMPKPMFGRDSTIQHKGKLYDNWKCIEDQRVVPYNTLGCPRGWTSMQHYVLNEAI